MTAHRRTEGRPPNDRCDGVAGVDANGPSTRGPGGHSPRIGVYGGSFDPPGLHHRGVVEAVLPHVDRLVVVPCGPRPDKPTTGRTAPHHRAALVRMAFGGIAGVTVDDFDLTAERFTRTWDLQARYEGEGEVWHVVGADLVVRGARGASEIQRQWYRGKALWETGRFLVLTRPGFDLTPADLPPRALQVVAHVQGRSRALRAALARGERPVPGLDPEIEGYIRAHHLYGT